MKTKDEILGQLPYFTGTEHYYATTFKRVVCTDGAHYVREACDAFWLIDAIATHLIGREKRDIFAHVLLSVKPNSSAVLTLDDGNGNVFAKQRIGATDFPLESIAFYAEFDGAHWVILLKSEH
jgi:hypothetical protein